MTPESRQADERFAAAARGVVAGLLGLVASAESPDDADDARQLAVTLERALDAWTKAREAALDASPPPPGDAAVTVEPWCGCSSRYLELTGHHLVECELRPSQPA